MTWMPVKMLECLEFQFLKLEETEQMHVYPPPNKNKHHISYCPGEQTARQLQKDLDFRFLISYNLFLATIILPSFIYLIFPIF